MVSLTKLRRILYAGCCGQHFGSTAAISGFPDPIAGENEVLVNVRAADCTRS